MILLHPWPQMKGIRQKLSPFHRWEKWGAKRFRDAFGQVHKSHKCYSWGLGSCFFTSLYCLSIWQLGEKEADRKSGVECGDGGNGLRLPELRQQHRKAGPETVLASWGSSPCLWVCTWGCLETTFILTG